MVWARLSSAFTRRLHLLTTFSNWPVYFSNKFGRRTKNEIVFLTRNGISITVPKKLYPEFKSIFFERVYLKQMISPLPRQPVIIDVGANIGLFSLFACMMWDSRVYAYEPIPGNIEALQAHVNANPDIHIEIRRMAVSGSSGPVIMHTDTDGLPTSAASLFPGSALKRQESVRSITLKEALDRESLSSVDLLKLDCEGSEFEILYGSDPDTLGRIRRIVAEVHPNRDRHGHDMESLSRFLNHSGFTTQSNASGSYLWAGRVDGGEDAVSSTER